MSFVIERGRKCGGSRWNRVARSFRSKVISTSVFHFRFPLPVSTSGLIQIFSLGCRPISGGVGSVISNSGVVENVGVAVGIASPGLPVQKLFPLPVFTSGFVADI